MPLDQAIEVLLQTIANIIAFPGTAALVITLTGISNWLLPRLGLNISGTVLAFAWQVVVWVALTIARHYGVVDEQFVFYGSALNTVLSTIATVFLGAGFTEGMYRVGKRLQVPGIVKPSEKSEVRMYVTQEQAEEIMLRTLRKYNRDLQFIDVKGSAQ